MGSPHTNLIRESYAAFNRGEIETVLKAFTDDVEWDAPGGAPYCGVRHGREQLRAFFQQLAELVTIDEFDLDDVIAEGDRAVALGRERATVRATGQHFEQRFVHVYTFRGDKIAAAYLAGDTHAEASAFGESTREREALTGPLGVTRPAFSGPGDME